MLSFHCYTSTLVRMTLGAPHGFSKGHHNRVAKQKECETSDILRIQQKNMTWFYDESCNRHVSEENRKDGRTDSSIPDAKSYGCIDGNKRQGISEHRIEQGTHQNSDEGSNNRDSIAQPGRSLIRWERPVGPIAKGGFSQFSFCQLPVCFTPGLLSFDLGAF